ncbi:putative phage tail protein [Pelosinus sp. IPA-1]|uniref:putative phage tail protein n=1 Tax=Pelosinus sp. IPA-1 TaxID=3029569 RepID=UPI00243614BE|nr:putative phage tail protein [Pelosinus sp. IPA-1]GMB01082.1 hypothetical protein PIPA1_38810 [Pelosinus sp. IPA-1]
MFFRENEVNILKYLPTFLQSDINFKSVADVHSAEHERIRLLIQDVFNQFFIETATWGLESYEKILDITPNKNGDYAVRRNRIKLRYQANQTSTVAFLESLVKRYATSNATIKVIENNSEYAFSIITEGGSIVDLTGMFEAIEIYKPAHLTCLLHYERPVNMSYSIGQVMRIGKKTTIKPVSQFDLNKIDGTAIYGCFIKTAKYTTIKAVV